MDESTGENESIQSPYDHELRNENEYETIEKLKKLAPIEYLKFLDGYSSAYGFLMIYIDGESVEASYQYTLNLINTMESEEFQSFISELASWEFNHN
jgi:hypothetical protein